MARYEGKLTREQIREAERWLDAAGRTDGPIVLDLGGVTEADSAGVAQLALFSRRMRAAGRSVALSNVPPAIEKTLALFPFAPEPEGSPPADPGFLESLGERTTKALALILDLVLLAADAFAFLVRGLTRRRGLDWTKVAYEMSSMGSRALGVVGLIAFLVGGTMALQSAVQLRQFGANIFVVDLISISMTRELGPLMAAIVVAGRSGSAIAAEVATMMISEEVDALRTMGINPTRFLIVPKLLAISITQPLLTALADLLGIFGGFLVAVLYLDVSAPAFVARLEQAMYVKDLLTGLVKSVLFAQLIVLVGTICGFRTRGGPDAVGRSTTTSVVAGIFAVITADTLASLLFYFGG